MYICFGTSFCRKASPSLKKTNSQFAFALLQVKTPLRGREHKKELEENKKRADGITKTVAILNVPCYNMVV